jgi:UDP-glucose 4-epimerase
MMSANANDKFYHVMDLAESHIVVPGCLSFKGSLWMVNTETGASVLVLEMLRAAKSVSGPNIMSYPILPMYRSGASTQYFACQRLTQEVLPSMESIMTTA